MLGSSNVNASNLLRIFVVEINRNHANERIVFWIVCHFWPFYLTVRFVFWIIWPFFGFYLIGSFKSFKVQIGDETIENGIYPYWSLQIVASRKY